jgi:hypothetical protein
MSCQIWYYHIPGTRMCRRRHMTNSMATKR